MSLPRRETTTPWWRRSIGYEIYLRSFQDSDGDGIGDLRGVTQRIPYLADLGVDLIWLTPFTPSPQHDHGYDVADYTGVDPTFGDLADLDELIATAHEHGLRVITDIVPNHSSSEHPWFQAALAGDPRYRDHYIWRDPAPDGGPPNNWLSHFGGPAWTFDEASGQYYLHLFLPEQPDLNWANPAVHDEFEDILRFWLDRGLDGFRVDVAHALVKDPQLRDNPLLGDAPDPGDHPKRIFYSYDHVHDLDQPGVVDVYRRWNAVAAEHDAVLLGEVHLHEPPLLTRYVERQDGLHTAFCFAATRTAWDAAQIRDVLESAVDAGNGHLSWPLTSHDDPRAATRFGGGERGARRQLAYWALLTTLPGVPFLYQGDELGMTDGRIAVSADPMSTRNGGVPGRDGSRTPVLWEPGERAGFTTGDPWLPVGDGREPGDTVAIQTDDPTSHLERVRRLHHLRRELPALVSDAPVRWLDTPDAVIGLRRDDVVSLTNTADGDLAVALPGDGRWEVVYATTKTGDGSDVSRTATSVDVPGEATVWLRRTD